jgi:chromosome segregation ATPase
MDQNEVKILIETFKSYRDLLTPIQSNLNDFIATYSGVQSDLDRLNQAFSGDARGSLDKIYRTLSSQAEKASDLATQIDKFMRMSGKYTEDISKLLNTVEKVADKLENISELETKAETQLGKLESILDEKRKSYNVKELQRTLENYDDNVRKMNEFINKDVAEKVADSNQKINAVKSGSEALMKNISNQKGSIEELTSTYRETNRLLKQIVEKDDVNEQHLYEVLDKWAETRRVKIKK